MKNKMLWKCLRAGMKSAHGNTKWVRNEWQTITTPLSICHHGFHASPTPLMAMGYVKPIFIAKVEVDGDCINQDDKSCHSSMIVREVWAWDKADSVALAIFAAELVIRIYEKRYPDNQAPRKAIDAAKAWLADPSEHNKNKAMYASDDAADAADDAADAAMYAANAAAIYAADDAANAAMYAADAADDAMYAANDAMQYTVRQKCNDFIIQRLNSKTQYYQ